MESTKIWHNKLGLIKFSLCIMYGVFFNIIHERACLRLFLIRPGNKTFRVQLLHHECSPFVIVDVHALLMCPENLASSVSQARDGTSALKCQAFESVDEFTKLKLYIVCFILLHFFGL